MKNLDITIQNMALVISVLPYCIVLTTQTVSGLVPSFLWIFYIPGSALMVTYYREENKQRSWKFKAIMIFFMLMHVLAA